MLGRRRPLRQSRVARQPFELVGEHVEHVDHALCPLCRIAIPHDLRNHTGQTVQREFGIVIHDTTENVPEYPITDLLVGLVDRTLLRSILRLHCWGFSQFGDHAMMAVPTLTI